MAASIAESSLARNRQPGALARSGRRSAALRGAVCAEPVLTGVGAPLLDFLKALGDHGEFLLDDGSVTRLLDLLGDPVPYLLAAVLRGASRRLQGRFGEGLTGRDRALFCGATGRCQRDRTPGPLHDPVWADRADALFNNEQDRERQASAFSETGRLLADSDRLEEAVSSLHDAVAYVQSDDPAELRSQAVRALESVRDLHTRLEQKEKAVDVGVRP